MNYYIWFFHTALLLIQVGCLLNHTGGLFTLIFWHAANGMEIQAPQHNIFISDATIGLACLKLQFDKLQFEKSLCQDQNNQLLQ